MKIRYWLSRIATIGISGLTRLAVFWQGAFTHMGGQNEDQVSFIDGM